MRASYFTSESSAQFTQKFAFFLKKSQHLQKNILADNRISFSLENMEIYLICSFNNVYKSTQSQSQYQFSTQSQHQFNYLLHLHNSSTSVGSSQLLYYIKPNEQIKGQFHLQCGPNCCLVSPFQALLFNKYTFFFTVTKEISIGSMRKLLPVVMEQFTK